MSSILPTRPFVLFTSPAIAAMPGRRCDVDRRRATEQLFR
jgi:hypothetical protein